MAHSYLSISSSHVMDGLSGCWTLARGRAVTLRAGRAGELQVARGRVWLTFDGAARDSTVRAGDYFVGAGESVSLAAGQALVMESFCPADDGPAYFSWEPVLAVAAASQAPRKAGIAQPLRELRAAAALLGAAAARLVRGLLGGLTV
ncbi:MAG: hypothetical protein JWQ72_759 [Polaromonas sp.]|nr:hypothetical protein [Polaromonas sp.]